MNQTIKYTRSGFNQPEVDSWDQHSWRIKRDNIFNSIRSWCNDNKVGYSSGNGCVISVNNILDIHKEQNVVYVQIFDIIDNNLESWATLSQRCQTENRKIFVITDNYIDQQYVNQFKNIYFFGLYELLGITANYKDRYLEIVPKTKLFNCFIQRTESVRQSWFYFLHDKNLISSGYVSFLLKQLQSYSPLTGRELFEYIHYNYQLNNFDHFDRAFHKLKSHVPFRNFDEQNDLLPLMLESKYSLILETFFSEPCGIWCWTEKTLRALQMPVIPLIFAQEESATQLKKIGFEIPDYLIEIDNLNWHERQQKFLNILVNDSVNESEHILLDRAKHNRNLLENWEKTYQHPNYLDQVYDIIKLG